MLANQSQRPGALLPHTFAPSPFAKNWATLWYVTLRYHCCHFHPDAQLGLCFPKARNRAPVISQQGARSKKVDLRLVRSLGQSSSLWRRWAKGGVSFSVCLVPFLSRPPTKSASYLWHISPPVHTTLRSCHTAGWRPCAHWASHNPAYMSTAAHLPSHTQSGPADGRLERMAGHHTAHLRTQRCSVKSKRIQHTMCSVTVLIRKIRAHTSICAFTDLCLWYRKRPGECRPLWHFLLSCPLPSVHCPQHYILWSYR